MMVMARGIDASGPVTPKGRATRQLLLDAGETVAARDALAGLSVASVAAQAGVAKGTFYIYFDDRNSFVEALRLSFYEHVEKALRIATADLPPGSEFLLAIAYGYLDVCLQHAAMKALVVEARASIGTSPSFTRLLDEFEALVGPSLLATGRGPVATSARLLVAMLSEVAMSEAERGDSDPEARLALRHWLSPD